MSEKRKLAEEIYSLLREKGFFHDGLYMHVHAEARKQKIIGVIEAEIPDVDAIRDAGKEDERLRLASLPKDPYLLGLHKSEVCDLIDKKFSDDVYRFKEGDMEALLNYIFNKFNWENVYEQIEDIAGEFIADIKTHMGRD